MDLNQALNKAYAKSTGEKIREHTDRMLERLQKIKKIRGEEILYCCPDEWKEHFWNLAEIVIEYHDYGKLHSPFQRRISKSGGFKEPYEIINVPEVPHNFLSPCFLPEEVLKRYETFLPVIIQAIAYHHERDIDERIFKIIVEQVIPQDLLRFKNPLFLKYWQYINPQVYINPKDRKLFKIFVLLKGLLHRVDYTASGDIDVEIEPENITDIISNKLREIKSDFNEIQKFALGNNYKDILIIAPTGSGKTEAGTLYINKSKGFFVLPLRVSIDSIYEKLTETPQASNDLKYSLKYIGLVHSTSLFKLIDKIEQGNSNTDENFITSDNFDQIYKSEKEAKNLSYPLSITTPDQLFPFVFKYGGFERVYSTLGYSKIVVDEIQMYNPRMLAFMLKGLQVVKELGGKIMIMTATFPEFLKRELEALNIKFGDNDIYKLRDLRKRHWLQVRKDEDVLDDGIIKQIEKEAEDKKVLVICNTVKKAVSVYEQIKCANKFLLHSRFIQKHRKILEHEIQKFAPNKSKLKSSMCGIWITTQLAEVSLDIDFDILFTELSTIDSLIQRMGRVNRAGKDKLESPNIVVCCKKKTDPQDRGCSGIGNIYDEKIFNLTRETLENGILSEDEKMELVERIYDFNKIRDTDYYKEFKNALSLINEIWEIGKIYNPIETLRQAQRQFREILTITLIPLEIYSNDISTIEDLKKKIISNKLDERINARKQLLDFTVSIPWHYVKNIKPTYFVDDVYIVPFKYDFDEVNRKGLGLLIDKLDDANLCD